MGDISGLFFLLIIFHLKHFTGNFSLRSLYQNNEFYTDHPYSGQSYINTLIVHSLIHGAITLGIVLIIKPSAWYLSIVDFVCHFLLDYMKLSKKLLGRWDVRHPLFWWGMDLVKLCHNFLYLFFAYILIVD